MFIAYVLFSILFISMPLLGRVILFIFNLMVDDPIPFIDEIIMGCSILRKMNFLVTQWEEHRVRTILLGIIFIIAMILFLN